MLAFMFVGSVTIISAVSRTSYHPPLYWRLVTDLLVTADAKKFQSDHQLQTLGLLFKYEERIEYTTRRLLWTGFGLFGNILKLFIKCFIYLLKRKQKYEKSKQIKIRRPNTFGELLMSLRSQYLQFRLPFIYTTKFSVFWRQRTTKKIGSQISNCLTLFFIWLQLYCNCFFIF